MFSYEELSRYDQLLSITLIVSGIQEYNINDSCFTRFMRIKTTGEDYHQNNKKYDPFHCVDAVSVSATIPFRVSLLSFIKHLHSCLVTNEVFTYIEKFV